MELVFAGLALLVREEHPYHGYNMKQFHSINIVAKIFKIYQVWFSVDVMFQPLTLHVSNDNPLLLCLKQIRFDCFVKKTERYTAMFSWVILALC